MQAGSSMDTFAPSSSLGAPIAIGDLEDPYLEVEGTEGSVLRATLSGLVVFPFGLAEGLPRQVNRRWDYGQLDGVHLDAYGPIGVIRAKSRTTGMDLPLLLLEPNQITAARRGLEMIWNLMSHHGTAALTS